jgi:hypothetical protein
MPHRLDNVGGRAAVVSAFYDARLLSMPTRQLDEIYVSYFVLGSSAGLT